MLLFFVGEGMVIDKVLEVFPLRQSKLFEKYLIFNAGKRNQVTNDFEKDVYNLLKIAFYGETMENVGNKTKLEFIREDDIEKTIKQKPKPFSLEFINFIHVMLVIPWSKMNLLWINHISSILLY